MSFFKENRNVEYIVKIGNRFVHIDPFWYDWEKIQPGHRLQGDLTFTNNPKQAWCTKDLDHAKELAEEYGGRVCALDIKVQEIS